MRPSELFREDSRRTHFDCEPSKPDSPESQRSGTPTREARGAGVGLSQATTGRRAGVRAT